MCIKKSAPMSDDTKTPSSAVPLCLRSFSTLVLITEQPFSPTDFVQRTTQRGNSTPLSEWLSAKDHSLCPREQHLLNLFIVFIHLCMPTQNVMTRSDQLRRSAAPTNNVPVFLKQDLCQSIPKLPEVLVRAPTRSQLRE